MDNIYEFIKLLLLTCLALLATFIMNYYIKKRGYKINSAVNYILISFVTVLLFVFNGFSVWTAKGIILALILLYASIQDVSTHEADDCLWVMLLILAFVNFRDNSIIPTILGSITVFLPQIIISAFTKNKGIGGADIKISTAASLSLGFVGGTFGYIVGLVFATVYQLIYNKINNRSQKEAFALLPFISAGLMIGYFI